MTAQWGSRGVVLSSFELSASWGCVVKATSWPIYFQERHCTHCIGDWLGLGAGLNRCGKTNPNRISNPNRPAH